MKKYKCPVCVSTYSVIKYGRQGRSLRFFCKKCRKHFSINPNFLNRQAILNDHLDGLSFRKLAFKYNISKSLAWEIVNLELKKLPDNNRFTFNFCNKFSHTFVFDGKYINVASVKKDLVLLWGIDYFRHDIPFFILSSSENYHSWARYFMFFRLISHRPELVVCDDNVNIKMAARRVFPKVKIQTCYNHFKENIRRNLKVRSDDTYKDFMRRIEEVFAQKLNNEAMNKKLFSLYRDYHNDSTCVSVLTNIEKYKGELLGYRGISQSPLTSNLIESFNSHLEGRLFSLKSFQSIAYAKLWFNAYVLKRRFTKFTDCRGKFRYLNGKRGIELTKKQGVDIPILFK